MPHDEHVLLLSICEEAPESPARAELVFRLAMQRGADKIAAQFRDFAGRRGFVTSPDWRIAKLTEAGRGRLAAERAILLTRTP